jgi:hypothetical protein
VGNLGGLILAVGIAIAALSVVLGILVVFSSILVRASLESSHPATAPTSPWR